MEEGIRWLTCSSAQPRTCSSVDPSFDTCICPPALSIPHFSRTRHGEKPRRRRTRRNERFFREDESIEQDRGHHGSRGDISTRVPETTAREKAYSNALVARHSVRAERRKTQAEETSMNIPKNYDTKHGPESFSAPIQPTSWSCLGRFEWRITS